MLFFRAWWQHPEHGWQHSLIKHAHLQAPAEEEEEASQAAEEDEGMLESGEEEAHERVESACEEEEEQSEVADEVSAERAVHSLFSMSSLLLP